MQRTLTDREKGKLEKRARTARARLSQLKVWTPAQEQRWSRMLQHAPRMLRLMAAKATLTAVSLISKSTNSSDFLNILFLHPQASVVDTRVLQRFSEYEQSLSQSQQSSMG